MRSTKRNTFVQLFIFFFVIAAFASTAKARSVYVITNCSASTIKAYDIQGDQLQYQATVENLPELPWSISLAIDADSEILFVTVEYTNYIELVNAKTMQYLDTETAPGASNLAGIAFDQNKQKLYAVEREYNKLYVYLWDANTKTLTLEGGTYKTLTNIYYAYGIALDESTERLYVTDATSTVHYYDTNDWTHKGSVNVGREAIGITIDANSSYLYTGGHYYNNYLVRYDLDSNSVSEIDTQYGVSGLAVDENTGFLYVTTTDDHIEVYNTATWPSDPCYVETADISGPADIALAGDVSYKPPLFYLEKVDINEPNSVLPDDYITYEITYGPNGYDHNNVIITDYLSYKVDYEDILDPNYDSEKHTYTWQIGSLSASAPQDYVTLTVKANECAEPNSIITNYCEIESDTACTPATADTNVGIWQPDSEIIYVDLNSPWPPGTGMSWRSAYVDLQDGLARAAADYGSEIWVAKGAYKPVTETGIWDANFALIDGVPVYGGFAGNETNRGQRNWTTNETILTGDIDDDGYADVNCVATASDVNGLVWVILVDFVDESAIIYKSIQVRSLYCHNVFIINF